MGAIIMDKKLPEIDELIKMASNDPEGLENMRKQLCEQLIQGAPEKFRKRLNGLQFQVDMARRKSNNPMHCCLKISEMMLDSYQDLQGIISQLDENDGFLPAKGSQHCAEIIQFKSLQKA